MNKCTKKKVLEAIKGSGGIMAVISQRLGCAWSTAQIYVNKWEDTKKAYKDETEIIKDFAESTIVESIKNGDTSSAKWYLSKKAKERGYSDFENQQTQTQIEDNELKVVLDFGN